VACWKKCSPAPGADVYVNADNTAALAVLLGPAQEEQLPVIERLVMHEVGHALGLGHPDASNPFGAQTNPTPLAVPAGAARST
jgi:hypothetical protein